MDFQYSLSQYPRPIYFILILFEFYANLFIFGHGATDSDDCNDDLR